MKTPAVDFRYSPLSWQTVFCYPDDPFKSIVGEHGELRYGDPQGLMRGREYFPEIIEFSTLGMEPDVVAGQSLEAPGVPVVHTLLDRPNARLELITFATNRAGEGRVDNVILEISPRGRLPIPVAGRLTMRTKAAIAVEESGPATLVKRADASGPLLLAVDAPLVGPSNFAKQSNLGLGWSLTLREGFAARGKPMRYFFRLPQEGQRFDQIAAGLRSPLELLVEAREFWRRWQPLGGSLSWKYPGRYGEFLVASARTLVQHREYKQGRWLFQAGPTVYRGLWVLDGHFILEAARYLGYDAAAEEALESTWSRQDSSGGFFAEAGGEHWKDTGIAMLTLVRQAELTQDWSTFRRKQPDMTRAARFLAGLREKARAEGSANGRYGLLARGLGDGGLGGARSEFTNTLWALAGLKALTEAADRLGLSGFEEARALYGELRSAFFAAARQETRRHPAGFDYLAMLMKEDPQWSAPNELDRPRPQTGQWALSQAIYPGLLFDREDPIVGGHLALMNACTREEVPAETGWVPYDGLWTNNAAFVAHVYLWAGLPDRARRAFNGFLNHASPLYCWREEQPLRGALVARYGGDMPHVSATADCIRYLRHMIALEDGPTLRLLPGIGGFELAEGAPFLLSDSPTRFGRISVRLEPQARPRGWRMTCERAPGPAPDCVLLPAALGPGLRSLEVKGAETRRSGRHVKVDPEATAWTAVWTQ